VQSESGGRLDNRSLYDLAFFGADVPFNPSGSVISKLRPSDIAVFSQESLD
jgi:hypothetical protein